MLFVYNFLQITLLLCTFPLLILVAGRRKYRERFWQRLGHGLRPRAAAVAQLPGTSRIWLHCLSVGEVTSALPLVRGLRRQMPSAQIIVSVTTSSGLQVAKKQMSPWADLVVAAPLDLRPVVEWFVRILKPDLFVLVETDFWPNWLHCLQKHDIPALLVNGRISPLSFARYQRFRFFFTPLFSAFTLLAMQTENDAAQMRALGVPADRLLALGNLKYAPAATGERKNAAQPDREALSLPANSTVWVCGSTHPGEEELLLPAFASLLAEDLGLVLLLAPRDPQRAPEIARLARELGLKTRRRSCPDDPPAPILLLDTLGELAACYRLARVAFIGGSLVPYGGHNPLEAVIHGVPVLFGPHMEDFQEIARDLLQCGGAEVVCSSVEIAGTVRRILRDASVHAAMRTAAGALAALRAGVIERHLAAMARLLDQRRG